MVDKHTSKALSWLLRHGANSEGLVVQPDGWVALADVLEKPNFKKVAIDDIKQVVADCPKQRFALKEENGQFFIKANQGHSFQVEDQILEEITDGSELNAVIHGTYQRHWGSIQQQGLSRMKRTHIHFAPGLPGESGVISGLRASCQIYIYINLPKALEAGFKFYKSANNVILCAGDDKGYLPAEYFLKVIERKTGKKLI